MQMQCRHACWWWGGCGDWLGLHGLVQQRGRMAWHGTAWRACLPCCPCLAHVRGLYCIRIASVLQARRLLHEMSALEGPLGAAMRAALSLGMQPSEPFMQSVLRVSGRPDLHACMHVQYPACTGQAAVLPREHTNACPCACCTELYTKWCEQAQVPLGRTHTYTCGEGV